MDQTHRKTGILHTLGEEIIRIITPVSICMLSVVILVSILDKDSSLSSSVSTIATIAYTETTSDSEWDKFKGALLNSLVFVAVVTVVTFLLVVLFYFNCTKFLKYYMGFSAFLVLGFMGGEIGVFLIQVYSVAIDCFTYLLLLLNFTIVGVLAVFMSKIPIFVTQSYMVVIGVLTAYWFTMLPEWTTWVLLVAMALYDLAAVLLPGGPLRLLVELAISRDEDIPALVYEARPVVDPRSNATVQRRVWRDRPVNVEAQTGTQTGTQTVGSSQNVEEGRVHELSVPLIERLRERGVEPESLGLEGIGLASTGAIKLGLGDFIFYSVLVGRAAMYDFMTVYACYLAIIAGLGITLVLLAVYQKALPALPVSVMLGVLFYVLTRFFLEDFIVQCSSNLLMF
ncbi:putative presenilin/signal peptide peptidase [Helianthus annuus]|uniref:Presenilin n=1 Tax=Helianthus annuus TaxID=4232 RepID=A0A251U0K1_HELAN|nr:presenilin-like protein At2g29900 [Helianthus annuus]KAF5792644.1 putative presenilin/signal peptide peptidase [Helianthus annuus]KAJ0527565.1 putative presenilin/signal peptide peptidase [Helianthus annuus]KAJ0536313.1 putative presenilin/signal peptide peptidase [Helianthus annuus]KAJ0543977.1 putative presenilin/signal peptide peptidase [Helianthus annuus]KAJ0709033.1 putative presenilin/signal peptide peptidase [Helianthus annuus]